MSPEQNPVSISDTPHYQDWLLSFVMGLVAFASIAFVIYRLGVDGPQAVVFALISAFAVAAFIIRERSLMRRIAEIDQRRLAEVGFLGERFEHLYQNSTAALALFDAGTLIVDRASAGFLDLLRVDAVRGVRGRRLEEILAVEATALERIVDDARKGRSGPPARLRARTAEGAGLELAVTAHYIDHLHMLEAAFQPLAEQEGEIVDMERALGDLERFRHGMARRELRILELKGEVNELLADSGESPRYKVDDKSEDKDPAVAKPVASKRGHDDATER